MNYNYPSNKSYLSLIIQSFCSVKYFISIVIAEIDKNNAKRSIVIACIIFVLVVKIKYKDIKRKTKEFSPKNMDKMIPKTLFFQKNCPIRQANKGRKKQNKKNIPHIHCLSLICPTSYYHQQYPY